MLLAAGYLCFHPDMAGIVCGSVGGVCINNDFPPFFFYSYEACFKGEIVLPGTFANHPSNRMIVQSTKKTFFLLLT